MGAALIDDDEDGTEDGRGTVSFTGRWLYRVVVCGGNTGCTVFAAAGRLAKIFVNWRPCLSGKDIRKSGRLRLMALDGPS